MGRAKRGDKVKAHFVGTIENGEAFLNTREEGPLEFIIGNGVIMSGLEEGVVDMKVGETKSITIPPEEAYGPRREELLVEVSRSDFPEHIQPSVGQFMQFKHKDGSILDVLIADLNDDRVTLDANHPLAGRTLLVDVELVEIL